MVNVKRLLTANPEPHYLNITAAPGYLESREASE